MLIIMAIFASIHDGLSFLFRITRFRWRWWSRKWLRRPRRRSNQWVTGEGNCTLNQKEPWRGRHWRRLPSFCASRMIVFMQDWLLIFGFITTTLDEGRLVVIIRVVLIFRLNFCEIIINMMIGSIFFQKLWPKKRGRQVLKQWIKTNLNRNETETNGNLACHLT